MKLKDIAKQPVASHLKLSVTGEHRVIGTQKTRTLGELLAEAEESGGVYGADNSDVDAAMPVKSLLAWNCDYRWTSTETTTMNPQSHYIQPDAADDRLWICITDDAGENTGIVIARVEPDYWTTAGGQIRTAPDYETAALLAGAHLLRDAVTRLLAHPNDPASHRAGLDALAACHPDHHT